MESQPRARRRHRYPRTALWVTAGLALAALAWMVIGVPTFVKYPTDLEASPHYKGTFRAYVDMSMKPLAQPMSLPLTIDRHIQAISDQSGASTVLVRENIDQKAGHLVNTSQTNDYVMDRSTLKNVADPRAYAFEKSNAVDRAGAYRLNLPFDTSRDETYPIYKNEIADTYTLASDKRDPTSKVEGLTLSNFRGRVDEAPLSDAYLAELNKAVKLPSSVTLDQLAPQLRAAGIDVDALTAALAPVLSPADAATLSTFAAQPIPLRYVLSFDGRVGIEPVTGAEVRVGAVETVGVRPVLTDLPALRQLLGRYPGVPAAVDANAALGKLANAPATKLFQFDYQQTRASVADIADKASSMRRQILAAKVWLPLGLAAVAVLSLAIGGAVYVRRGRTAEAQVGEQAPARGRRTRRRGLEPTPGRSSA